MDSPESADSEIDRRVHDPHRLAAVRRIGQLDTPTEEAFDVMTRLATKLVGAAASFLTIVDDHRDFYKSQNGFPPALATCREIGGRTFCHYTLQQSEPLVIKDTEVDPVWSKVPTVKSLGVRAYIGVPIIIDGQHVGSFCVIDTKPRHWSPLELDTVKELGASAGREIVLRDKVRDCEARAEAATALAKSNTELLTVVAHDLRTPLQTIGLTAAMLRHLVDPATASYVGRLEAATQAMTGMVDSLLETHAVGSRAAKLPVVMAAARLLADAIETVVPVAEGAGIIMTLGDATKSQVEVDYAAMLRVFSNLLSNCLKYCPAGSTVLLTAMDCGGQVVFRIADNGPGMSTADQASAFDRGWQGNGAATGKQGSGLGLSIVRQLVEENGGQVAFDANAPQGTTVVIALPRRSPI